MCKISFKLIEAFDRYRGHIQNKHLFSLSLSERISLAALAHQTRKKVSKKNRNRNRQNDSGEITTDGDKSERVDHKPAQAPQAEITKGIIKPDGAVPAQGWIALCRGMASCSLVQPHLTLIICPVSARGCCLSCYVLRITLPLQWLRNVNNVYKLTGRSVRALCLYSHLNFSFHQYLLVSEFRNSWALIQKNL